MTRARAAFVAAVMLCAGAAALRAQTPVELLNRGVRATHELEFDSAAAWLRRALAAPAPNALPDSSRSRAMMYLGANEFFRDRRDSSVAVFRRLIAQDPRYRPDLLVFPPEVTTLFSETRLGVRSVSVVVPGQTDLAGPGDRVPIKLYASSVHDVNATIARYFGGTGGAVIRTLYSGAVGDSLEFLWDGRDSAGVAADSGSYMLRVASRGIDGRTVRTVEVPLEVRGTRRDTLPWPAAPADSLLRPEHTASGNGVAYLATGLATAAVAVVLPSITSPDAEGASSRYVVASLATVGGIVGMLRARKPRPIPENIAANQRVRDSWQRQADQARAENEARRREAHLVVRAGTPRVVEGGR